MSQSTVQKAKRISSLRLFITGILMSFCFNANAVIINIDSKVHGSPAAPLNIFFTAGSYNVSVIGTADGGAFDAWSAWSSTTGCNTDGTLCTTGWLNSYQIQSTEIGVLGIINGGPFATELQALANAIGTSFTLNSDTIVGFSQTDGLALLGDNRGGISLEVIPAPIISTPEPTTLVLLSIGIVGLGFNKRKINDPAAS